MTEIQARDITVPIAVAPESLASARAAIAAAVPEWPGDAVYAAQLVAVELLTNAWLHGAPPVTLTLRATDETLRIEVSDGSDHRPVLLIDRSPDATPLAAAEAVSVESVEDGPTEGPGRRQAEGPFDRPAERTADTSDTGGMVGRGLTVIRSLAAEWGATPREGGGKTVHAVIRRHATLDTPTESAAAATADADLRSADLPIGDLPIGDIPAPRPPVPSAVLTSAGSEPRYAVTMTAPTRLILDVNSRVDDVMRELSLIATQSPDEVPDEAALTPELARAVHSATHDWVDIRRQIQEQALAAAHRGEAFTELTLELPATAAEQGRRFLEAMDRAEQLARVGRLLVTPETPSQHAFRHWSVAALVAQVEAAAEGRAAPLTAPFGEVLSSELDRLASLEEAWDRLQLLQRIAAGLTAATTAEQAAQVVAQLVVTYRGVLSVRIYAADQHPQTGEDILRTVAYLGRNADVPDAYDVIPLDSDVPGAVAARTGTPIHRTRLTEIYESFPDLRETNYYPTERSLHVLPVGVGERPLGLVAITFADASLAPQSQIDLVRVIADTLAQTLERIRASQAATAAAERVTLLADASIALSVSLELQPTVDAVLDVLVPRFADWAVVQIVRDGTLVTVGLQHHDPERRRWALSMRDRWPTDMTRDSGAPAIVRTGTSELYPVIDSALIEATAVDEEHLAALQNMGISSALSVALTGRSGVIGVLTLVRGDSGVRYRHDDLPLVEDIARRAALAIETAETFREQSGRLANVTRIADAAQRAILTDPPSRIGPVALAARYVSAAAEARVGGDLYDALALPDRVRLLIGDVRGKGLGAVRTATIVLGAFRAAATEVSDLAGALSQMDARVRRFLGEEDFITAAMVDIHVDGRLYVASAGHPAPFLASRAVGLRLQPVELEPSAPLGLGGRSEVAAHQLEPGDRVLLYTDGLLEARDPHHQFVDVPALLSPLTEPLPEGGLGATLDAVLDRLQRATGARLGDDLALLALEYRGAEQPGQD